MFTDGFLGYRTSFMLDFVVCALVIIVPALVISICLVKFGHRYGQHRLLQTVLCAVLLVAVGAFEVDLQLVHGGWENVVAKGYSDEALLAARISRAQPWLWLHLVFAVSTPVLWIVTLAMALRRFPSPPTPSEHSSLHRKLGWLSTVDVTLTAVTGLIFYYVAFVAA
jgi:putative membrane protein